MQPTTYTRQIKTTSQYLGKNGIIVASTLIHVAPPKLSAFTPYCFVLVDLGDEKKELMGVPGEKLNPGDKVKCVLRKSELPDDKEVIGYAIKVKRI